MTLKLYYTRLILLIMLTLMVTDKKIFAQISNKPKYIMTVLLNDKTRIKGFLMDYTDSTMIMTTVRKPHKQTSINNEGNLDYSERMYAAILSIRFDDIIKVKISNTNLFRNSVLIMTGASFATGFISGIILSYGSTFPLLIGGLIGGGLVVFYVLIPILAISGIIYATANKSYNNTKIPISRFLKSNQLNQYMIIEYNKAKTLERAVPL